MTTSARIRSGDRSATLSSARCPFGTHTRSYSLSENVSSTTFWIVRLSSARRMRFATELTAVESEGYPDGPDLSTGFSPHRRQIAAGRPVTEMFREKTRRLDDFRECDAGRNAETF